MQALGQRLVTALAWIVVRVYFRRIDVVGRDRIPDDRPVLLVANHVNGVIDPALVLATLPGRPRFLAAGILWKYWPLRILLGAAGAVPAFRRADGSDTTGNVVSFQRCFEVLARRGCIALFPEGDVHDEPGLLPLKTGAARIALGAALGAGVQAVVVPVGLVYDHRTRFRSQAVVHVGAPVPIDAWVESAAGSPPDDPDHDAVHGLTDAIADGLRDVTLGHATWREAAIVDRAAAVTIAGTRDSIPHQPVFAERTELHHRLATALAARGGTASAAFRELEAAVEEYGRDLALLGLRAEYAEPGLVPRRPGRALAGKALLQLALTPLAAIGVVCNIVPVLVVLAARRFVHDPAWRASVEVVVALVAFPTAWALAGTLVRWHYGFWASVAFTGVAALTGLAWIAWVARWRRLRLAARRVVWFRRPNVALTAALSSRARIIALVDDLVSSPVP